MNPTSEIKCPHCGGEINPAAVLGTMAFNAGMKRIPAMDKNLEPLLAGNQIGEGIPVLKAWLASWDAANLINAMPDIG